jgi:hypothetical protein
MEVSHMAQQTRQDDSVPNRSSNMEQAEGSRETVRDNTEQGGGITNRSLDEEMKEQEQLPERGSSKSESRERGSGEER